MLKKPVYMDNQATTQVDPRVMDAMLPFFCERYGNAGSLSHAFGSDARDAVDCSRTFIARAIGAAEHEIIFTSGATESNNLVIRGVCGQERQKGNHVISVATEHKAVLEPLERLVRRGFEVTFLPVTQNGHPQAGILDLDRLTDAIREDTLLVSVMLANNEIGVIQPLEEIGGICKERGILLHTDATQAVGKLPVDVNELNVDLMSFSAHKIYGPKGMGALYVRQDERSMRIEPQINGGGQEAGFRSGTLNVPGIVGFAKALELCVNEMPRETIRLCHLRNRLSAGFASDIDGSFVNGPFLNAPTMRLVGNLNCCFPGADGEALMMNMPDLAVASGSACTSADPSPSHVLKVLGLSDDDSQASLRFAQGRFNREEDVDFAIETVADAVEQVRRVSKKR